MADRDVSFASFNLYNLQLPGEAIYSDADGWTREIYDRKIGWTGDTLRRLSADFVGFQELWAKAALEDALENAGLSGSHKALVPPDHDGGKIVCAGAVREDMLASEPEWITDFPDEMVLRSDGDDPQTESIAVNLSSFSRPVLHARVQPDPSTPVIEVFVCHFKSRRPTQIWRENWYDRDTHGDHVNALGYAISTIRRTAEAAALRVIVTKIAKKTDTPVVIIGDMNDGKQSNTLNILTEQPSYLAPLSFGGVDNGLYTAQTLQEYRSTRDVYYTHVFKKDRESLDHILFSEQFYDNSEDRLWLFREMIVENDHLNFEDHKFSGTGDHGVIRTEFRWKPTDKAKAALGMG
ncbi:endonuclease/exonuclease/phosphatase family protein [Notoacmeibacter sp. MSK16QG-6]|uniref:endonuclease/exonuclease/phosphatase family protein n=1 Tax=Notoacmeibacter sp. MSK16QG-6 TaxID=2957982 RepID=UPI0020A1D015|nr:endonuclease/exonuclease/phosphatase family protein [Notoacmeibacter sp. MSK16QG-6]MCP1199147.1 endonuclease/exonuclease/phosphatase family protein [Notoacmeibacter sp. MSK16QG-6]